jgi:uncharacterized protein YcbX
MCYNKMPPDSRGLMSDREIGRVVALFRYPVKSMCGESLQSVQVGWAGFAGDRRWAFVRAGMERSDFPWLTIRERPEMWQYRPRFAEPDKPDSSMTIVQTPAGLELDVVDEALAEELGFGARVIKQGRGIFDALPLSLISTQTVSQLGEYVGSQLDPRRFRPNILVDANDGDAFFEDGLVSNSIRIGDMRMRVDKRDKRCVVTNVDPTTITKNPEVLRAIAQQRQSCLGVYGSTVQPGAITVGDSVFLES